MSISSALLTFLPNKNMKIITNVNILRDNNLQKVDIYIENEKIVEIENSSHKNIRIEKIDGSDLLALPGIIDSHVHFDDPGYTQREDFETGTKSAIAGGVTTVVDMPCTSIPPVTDKQSLEYKLNIISKKAYADFALWGGVTPQLIDNGKYYNTLKDLKENGVTGIKFYTISSMEAYPRMDSQHLYKAFTYLKEIDLPAAVHSEDFELVDLFSSYVKSKGFKNPLAWCKGRVYEAEEVAILKVATIARETKTKLHIVHLTSKKGLDIIRRFKDEGVDITTETCPHYLYFTESDFEKIGPVLKTAPPVRRTEDVEALWKGLFDGTINFVASDHAGGIYPEEKNNESIWENYAGIPGTQLILPVLLTIGYHKKKMPLSRIQELTSTNPARRYKLEGKGKIEKGYYADMVLVNLEKEWIFDNKMLYCKNKYSPFNGMTFKGKVEKTILRGNLVYDSKRGFTEEQGLGKHIKASL